VGTTPSRRSTHHGVGLDGAASSGEDSLAKAMRRNAVANFDCTGINKSSKFFLSFATPLIATNLNNVSLSLGNSVCTISVPANAHVWSLIDQKSLL
jgi:hypothetical protein